MLDNGEFYAYRDCSVGEYHERATLLAKSTATDTGKARREFAVKICAASTDATLYPLSENFQYTDKTKGVAVIGFTGDLTPRRNWWNVGTEDVLDMLKWVGENENTTAVVLKINTGGGSIHGIINASKEIEDFEKTYGKKLVVLVNAGCYSAGIWLTCGASKIYIEDAVTGMGSIGTMQYFYDDTEFMKKEGVKVIKVTALESFNKNKEDDNVRKGKTDETELKLSKINAIFLDRVKTTRGNKLDLSLFEGTEVPAVFTGLEYIGQDVVNIGLADGIKSEKEIINELISEAEKAIEVELFGNDYQKNINMSVVRDSLSVIAAALGIGSDAPAPVTPVETPAPVVAEVVETPEAPSPSMDEIMAKVAKDAAEQAANLVAKQYETKIATLETEKAAAIAAKAKSDETLEGVTKIVQNLVSAQGGQGGGTITTPSVNEEKAALSGLMGY